MKKWMIPLVGVGLVLAITATACGNLTTPEPRSTTGPTPTTPSGLSPGDAPTQSRAGEMARECTITSIGFPGPIDALRGVDRIPTGFDPVNSAGCTFTKPIVSVTLELLREGETIVEQEITLVPPSKGVGFPLPKDKVTLLPDKLEPGPYDRRIQVMSVEGEMNEMVTDTIWIFDPVGHPVTAARHALAEQLGVDTNVTFLETYRR